MNIEIKRLDASEGSCNKCYASQASQAGTSGKIIKTIVSATFHCGSVGFGIRLCDSCWRSFVDNFNAANESFIIESFQRGLTGDL